MYSKTLKEKFIVATIAVCATPIHELGHWIGYRFSGVPAVFYFNYTKTLGNLESIWGIAGGPIISLILALLGLIMMYIYKNEIWAFLSVIMCLTRLLPYIVLLFVPSSITINDEGLIANALGLQTWVVYSIFLILFVSIISIIIHKYKMDLHSHLNKYGFGYILYLILSIVFGVKII